MASDHKTHVQETSNRIIGWLLEHRTEFEQDGVEEASLVAGVGLTEDEVREAIDHLENHEDVARVPEALSNPPRFIVKPARGWPEIVDSYRGEKHASGKV